MPDAAGADDSSLEDRPMSDSRNDGGGKTPTGAWVWSQYRGVLPDSPTPPGPAPTQMSEEMPVPGLARASKSEEPSTTRAAVDPPPPQRGGAGGGAIAFIVALAILTLAAASWWLAASRSPPPAAPPVEERGALPALPDVSSPSEREPSPTPSDAAPPLQQDAAPAAEPSPPVAAPAEQGAAPDATSEPERKKPKRRRH